MKVICISGKARHGKDTLAKIMKEDLEEHGYKVLVTHFGDLLKYICKMFFDWNGEKDNEGRTLLQYIGTDVIRSQNPNYWTNFIIDVLSMFSNEWDYVLIPDCRFPNEFECFKEHGFETYLVRIDRPKYDSGLTDQQLNHPSETAMDDYKADYYIINTTLDSVITQVSQMIKQLGG